MFIRVGLPLSLSLWLGDFCRALKERDEERENSSVLPFSLLQCVCVYVCLCVVGGFNTEYYWLAVL